MAWTEIIATGLSLLQQGGIAASAGSAVYPIVKLGQWLSALHQNQSAANSDDSTKIDGAISDAVHAVVMKAKGDLSKITNGKLDSAISDIQLGLKDWGITIDSAVLKQKARARLGELLLAQVSALPKGAAASPPAAAPTSP